MKHKWHKEIKAWADGAEVEVMQDGVWMKLHELCNWSERMEYRIKPQPKEPQYLYVYKEIKSSNIKLSDCELNNLFKFIGKIKLETDE